MFQLAQGVRQFQQATYPDYQNLFHELAKGQHPPTLFITCSDSRIDPALLTQTRPGDLFVLRTAGNIVPIYEEMLGGEAATIEYAVAVLKVQHVVVCGHAQCGAVTALMKDDDLSSLPAVDAYLQHAKATRQVMEKKHAAVKDEGERVKLAIQTNVLVQLENLKTHPSVAAALSRNELTLHGWVYDFKTGQVVAHETGADRFVALESLPGSSMSGSSGTIA